MFTPAKSIKPHIKVLVMGPSGTGKTHAGLELPGPIAGFDMEDGLYPFSQLFDFDIDREVSDIEDLNKKIRSFKEDKTIHTKYETLHIDGVTKLWHEALRDAETTNGQINFNKQREVKSGGKELTDLIMDLGRIDKNVWVTVQAKQDWEVGRDNKPVLKGMKGDMDQRLFYAFDLVFYLEVIDNVRTAKVLKSRFPQYKIGQTLPNFTVETYLNPILSGTKSSPEKTDTKVKTGTNDTAEQQRNELKVLAQELGSEAKGGKIPTSTANRVNAVLKGQGSPEEVGELLSELEALRVPEAV